MAVWAGSDLNGQCTLDFAQDAVDVQVCPLPFEADSLSRGDGQVGSGNEGDVFGASRARAAFGVVHAQNGFQIPTVTFDAPAQHDQTHELLEGYGRVRVEVQVIGGFLSFWWAWLGTDQAVQGAVGDRAGATCAPSFVSIGVGADEYGEVQDGDDRIWPH